MGIEFLKVLFLGIVEGVTEWLPISSTGHLILVDEFLQLNASESFKEMFQVVIQLGAIFAVVCVYFDKLKVFDLWKKVIVACIPAGVAGVLLDDWMEAHLFNYIVVAMMLITYGVLFLAVEKRNRGRNTSVNTLPELTYSTAFFIGIFQMLSLVPGTSRSGATIIGAMLLGVSRYVATEFTFFLAIPVMFGASGLKITKFFVEGNRMTAMELGMISAGFAVAFLVSIFAIKFLMGYIKRHSFRGFGYYRIVLGIFVLLYFLILQNA